MSARFTWNGLDEQYRDLRALALDLAQSAGELAQVKAMAASGAIASTYPYRSGSLRNRVTVETLRPHGARGGSIVLSAARHAYVYDRGSHGNRRTSMGWNRGGMPRGNVFVPRMQRARKEFLADVKRMLPRFGLEGRGNV